MQRESLHNWSYVGAVKDTNGSVCIEIGVIRCLSQSTTEVQFSMALISGEGQSGSIEPGASEDDLVLA